MATFNGWTILPMPAVPAAPSSVEWNAIDMVAISQSAFSGQQQIQNWNSSWLEASVNMPVMTPTLFREWQAWLMGLKGQSAVFQLGDPILAHPRGTGLGTPTVVGSGQTGYTLATTGWSGANALLAGDFIQIGYRLYTNLVAIGAGSQTLTIWPQIRESPLNGTPIVIHNTQGLFRLKSNSRKWSLNGQRYYSFGFEIREAL